MSVLDPMTIDGCGISSHQFEFLKNFRQSLKFGQTLLVVSILVRYYQVNQSVNISHLQSSDDQMPDFSAKMHHIQFRLGLLPDPAGRAFSAPQTP